jgi:hypothetical protein
LTGAKVEKRRDSDLRERGYAIVRPNVAALADSPASFVTAEA